MTSRAYEAARVAATNPQEALVRKPTSYAQKHMTTNSVVKRSNTPSTAYVEEGAPDLMNLDKVT